MLNELLNIRPNSISFALADVSVIPVERDLIIILI